MSPGREKDVNFNQVMYRYSLNDDSQNYTFEKYSMVLPNRSYTKLNDCDSSTYTLGEYNEEWR